MTNDLTDNDRQRIEQKCIQLFNEWVECKQLSQVLFEMGEYATIYEREKQIKTLSRPGSKYYVSYDPDYKDKVFGVFNKEDLTQQGAEKMAQQLNNLEAERSEMRNLLEESQVLMCECIQVFNGSYELKDRYEKLLALTDKIENSLKTK